MIDLPIGAQGVITAINSAPTGTASSRSAVEIDATGLGYVGVQVTGTYTAASGLTAQVSVDGATWVSLAATDAITNLADGTTAATIASAATGIYSVQVKGAKKFRITSTGAVTGSAQINMQGADMGSGGGSSSSSSSSSAWGTPVTLSSNTSLTHASHANRTIFVDTAGLTLTINNDATGGWLADDILYIREIGAGTFTLVQGTATLTTPAGTSAYSPTAAGNVVTADRTGTDAWEVTSPRGADPSMFIVSTMGYSKPTNLTTSALGTFALGTPSTLTTSTAGGTAALTDGSGGYGSIPRVRVTSTAANNNTAGYNSAATMRLDHDPSRFPVYVAMAIADATPTDGTGFMGIVNTLTATIFNGVEVSGLTSDHLGIGFDTTDANWQIFSNDNAGSPTKTDTGIVRAQYDALMVEINKNAAGTEFYVRIYRWATGLWSSVYTVNTTLPRASQTYHLVAARGTFTDLATAVAVDFIGFQVGRAT